MLTKLLILLAITFGGLFFAARFVINAAKGLLGIENADPSEKAALVAGRVQKHLAASTAGEMYGPVLAQLGDVVKTRLPLLVTTRKKLDEYLGQKSRVALERDIGALRDEWASTRDAELRRIVEKNLKLATDRLEAYDQMQLILDRTVAQIKNVVLTLEALEDRVVSANLSTHDDGIATELEGMLTDVAMLEGEYRKLKLLS